METFQAIKSIAAELWLFQVVNFFLCQSFYAKISYDVLMISSFTMYTEFKSNLGANLPFSR